jgi:hypothetical protein
LGGWWRGEGGVGEVGEVGFRGGVGGCEKGKSGILRG